MKDKALREELKRAEILDKEYELRGSRICSRIYFL